MHKKQSCTLGNRKVVIISAGYVGSSIAYALALRDVAREIAMIDINHGKTDWEAKDIRHGFPRIGTAGRGRKPGESRFNLIKPLSGWG